MKKLKVLGSVLTVVGGAITIISAFVHSKIEEQIIENKVSSAISKMLNKEG